MSPGRVGVLSGVALLAGLVLVGWRELRGIGAAAAGALYANPGSPTRSRPF